MSYSKLSSVPHKLPEDLKRSQLDDFTAYKTWLSNLEKSLDLQHQQKDHPFHKDPYQLKSIEVQCCDFFGGGRLGFVKLKAEISNDAGEKLPGSVFLRGGSVAMLILLRNNGGKGKTDNDSSGKGDNNTSSSSSSASSSTEHVILTVQPRVPGGSMGFVELPAGMIDDSGSFAGAAAKEIKEETGLEIKDDDLINMTELAIDSRPKDEDTTQSSDEDHLQKAIYPSPGGSDEFIPVFLARKTMSSEEIDKLKGKLTGLRDHGEKITLKICRLDELWKVGARDGKTLAAVALYEGLKRERRI